MALTGKQVRQLRSLAHHLNPIIHIGKSDISDALVKETEAALENRELIKCAVQDGSDLETREAADMLAERTNADVVQVIGHRFSLYRESSRDDIEKIKLV
ncbi:ribosome assembly RNA-binding protein YhbY [Collinsella tanakaei]|uniref:ribosome assembly RNA-binding protein YhbY n=1 Tax=Collinsella tanakaei TaxID=626935 RepID=UPI0039F639C0